MSSHPFTHPLTVQEQLAEAHPSYRDFAATRQQIAQATGSTPQAVTYDQIFDALIGYHPPTDADWPRSMRVTAVQA